MTIKGVGGWGVRRLREKTILNFHFDYLNTSLSLCLKIMRVRRIPKVSIFMAVTTKIVTEKAQKWQY